MTISSLLLLGFHVRQRHVLGWSSDLGTVTPQMTLYRLCTDCACLNWLSNWPIGSHHTKCTLKNDARKQGKFLMGSHHTDRSCAMHKQSKIETAVGLVAGGLWRSAASSWGVLSGDGPASSGQLCCQVHPAVRDHTCAAWPYACGAHNGRQDSLLPGAAEGDTHECLELAWLMASCIHHEYQLWLVLRICCARHMVAC